MATKVEGPSQEYLQRKRGSVFQKTVEMNQLNKFVAPVFKKNESDTEKIL